MYQDIIADLEMWRAIADYSAEYWWDWARTKDNKPLFRQVASKCSETEHLLTDVIKHLQNGGEVSVCPMEIMEKLEETTDTDPTLARKTNDTIIITTIRLTDLIYNVRIVGRSDLKLGRLKELWVAAREGGDKYKYLKQSAMILYNVLALSPNPLDDGQWEIFSAMEDRLKVRMTLADVKKISLCLLRVGLDDIVIKDGWCSED